MGGGGWVGVSKCQLFILDVTVNFLTIPLETRPKKDSGSAGRTKHTVPGSEAVKAPHTLQRPLGPCNRA